MILNKKYYNEIIDHFPRYLKNAWLWYEKSQGGMPWLFCGFNDGYYLDSKTQMLRK